MAVPFGTCICATWPKLLVIWDSKGRDLCYCYCYMVQDIRISISRLLNKSHHWQTLTKHHVHPTNCKEMSLTGHAQRDGERAMVLTVSAEQLLKEQRLLGLHVCWYIQ